MKNITNWHTLLCSVIYSLTLELQQNARVCSNTLACRPPWTDEQQVSSLSWKDAEVTDSITVSQVLYYLVKTGGPWSSILTILWIILPNSVPPQNGTSFGSCLSRTLSSAYSWERRKGGDSYSRQRGRRSPPPPAAVGPSDMSGNGGSRSGGVD